MTNLVGKANRERENERLEKFLDVTTVSTRPVSRIASCVTLLYVLVGLGEACDVFSRAEHFS